MCVCVCVWYLDMRNRSQELSDFYEAKLTEAGVKIVPNVKAERLWGLEEQVWAREIQSEKLDGA